MRSPSLILELHKSKCQVWLLLNSLQCDCKAWDIWGWYQVEKSFSGIYKVSEAGHRYIGWLANVTLDETSRENVSQKNTSSVALEYFKQVITRSWLLFGTDQHFSSQLKREEVVALYEFFKEDFLMFGYSCLLYLTWHFGKLTQRLATFKPFQKGIWFSFFTFQTSNDIKNRESILYSR